MKGTVRSLMIACASLCAPVLVLADGAFFWPTEIGSAGELAQTRQEVLLTFFEAAPPVDECEEALAGDPFDGSIESDLGLATGSAPAECGAGGDHPDQWHRYRAPGDGQVEFSLSTEVAEGVAEEMSLAVYDGCPGGGGARLACGSAADSTTPAARQASLAVVGGQSYLVRVIGPPALTYTLAATYTPAPPADDCADAPLLPGGQRADVAGFAATNDATVDCGPVGSPDLWYRYVAARDGRISIRYHGFDVSGEWAPIDISVHSGCPGTRENWLVCALNSEDTTPVEEDIPLDVTAESTYYIRVARPGAAVTDGFYLVVNEEEAGAPAAGEDGDGAAVLPYTKYVLSSSYTGDPAEFAWVIPVPSVPAGIIAHESREVFDSLDMATRPRFYTPVDWGGGGCGCAAAGGPVLTGEVTVEASGQAGVFDWAALTSTDARALYDWLSTNGFALPAAATGILDGYVADGRSFLALRIGRPEEVAVHGDGSIAIPPIEFTCQTAERFYPMVISQVSAAEETEVVVYTCAEHRNQVANLWNVTIDPAAVVLDPDSASGTNYEDLFQAAIQGHEGLVLVTEYAGVGGQPMAGGLYWEELPPTVCSSFLTRMRTILRPTAMTRDFQFQDAPSDDAVSAAFYVATPSEAIASRAAVQGFGVLALFGFSRLVSSRRRRTRA